ncbi:hypothetical protein MRX96_002837 [Rhipicephalus microplus]
MLKGPLKQFNVPGMMLKRPLKQYYVPGMMLKRPLKQSQVPDMMLTRPLKHFHVPDMMITRPLKWFHLEPAAELRGTSYSVVTSAGRFLELTTPPPALLLAQREGAAAAVRPQFATIFTRLNVCPDPIQRAVLPATALLRLRSSSVFSARSYYPPRSVASLGGMHTAAASGHHTLTRVYRAKKASKERSAGRGYEGQEGIAHSSPWGAQHYGCLLMRRYSS